MVARWAYPPPIKKMEVKNKTILVITTSMVRKDIWSENGFAGELNDKWKVSLLLAKLFKPLVIFAKNFFIEPNDKVKNNRIKPLCQGKKTGNYVSIKPSWGNSPSIHNISGNYITHRIYGHIVYSHLIVQVVTR